MPRISVIMSVYNSEAYLAEAVNSILQQTYEDFEFIIINDGSSDHSNEILAAYHDSRIRYVEQANIGLTRSLNKGIAMAQGEYIARMDADDRSMPERFANEVAFLEQHQDHALVGTVHDILNAQGAVIRTVRPLLHHEALQRILPRRNQFAHGSVMFRKQMIQAVGGYRRKFWYCQDYDLYLRLVNRYKLANLSEVGYQWRDRPQSRQTAIKKIFYRSLARVLYFERQWLKRELSYDRLGEPSSGDEQAPKDRWVRYCQESFQLILQNRSRPPFVRDPDVFYWLMLSMYLYVPALRGSAYYLNRSLQSVFKREG
jgi:glycosyltransferase involved in cell wall biosynthesis